MKRSKFFRTLWNINSVIILLIGLLLLTFIITDKVSEYFKYSESEYSKGLIVRSEKNAAGKLNFDLQHLLYETPVKIEKSGYYYSAVRVVDKEIPESIKLEISSANHFNMDMLGGTINIIFFNKDEAYTLLDNFGFISYVDVLSENPNSERTTSILNEYVLYKIALNDSNKDGRINSEDEELFYVSDNRGKNLKQITPNGLKLELVYSLNYSDNLILFEEVTKISDKDESGFSLKNRRVYSYDFSTLKFSKLDKLENVFQKLQEKYRSK